jgi:hypothetical protein
MTPKRIAPFLPAIAPNLPQPLIRRTDFCVVLSAIRYRRECREVGLTVEVAHELRARGLTPLAGLLAGSAMV